MTLALAAGYVNHVGCHWGTPQRVVSLARLEAAPLRFPTQTARAVLGGADTLGDLYHELTPRLGYFVVTDQNAWQRLTAVAPSLRAHPAVGGPRPDFRRGGFVGIVSRAGTPVDGDWPIMLDGVRLRQGGALIEASFNGGSYFPDDCLYAEAAYVEGLTAVLVVEVNGLRTFAD